MRAVMVLVLASGCSFVFVKSPRHVGRMCTTSGIPAAVDTAGTLALLGIALVAEATDAMADGGNHGTANLIIGAASASAIATAISAGYGFTVRSRCIDFITDPNAEAALDQERAREHAHELVVALHHHARAAAGDDRCDIVQQIAARLRELDAAYYETDVARDGKLARCLSP